MLTLTAVLGSAAWATPGDDTGRFPWEGEVSGTNVYVRSGPGTNYYPTTKLNAGDRVVVLGEKFGWYQIVPPRESFSYIDLAGVQRKPGAKTGEVVQDRVYVRAGSHLRTSKTSTQLVLSRGTVVEIIGETEGFFKIVPPPGASLYMSKDYVQFVPPRLRTGLVERHLTSAQTSATTRSPAVSPAVNPAAGSPVAKPPEDKVETVATNEPQRLEPAPDEDGPPLKAGPTMGSHRDEVALTRGQTKAAANRSADLPAEASTATSGRHQALLMILESELRTMLQQPLIERDLGSLLPRYEGIASQTEETLPARIAKVRMSQLNDLIDLRAGRARILTEVEDLGVFRSRMAAERMKIMRRRMEVAMEKFDLEGELRLSYAFAPEKRRYRLVDPHGQTTIAYVDIPRSVGVDMKQMIGRFVGIRTAGQQFSSAARVPIAVAASVTDLTPRTAAPSVGAFGHVSRTANNRAEIDKAIPGADRSDRGATHSQWPVVIDDSPEDE
jgi:hypothetical protein